MGRPAPILVSCVQIDSTPHRKPSGPSRWPRWSAMKRVISAVAGRARLDAKKADAVFKIALARRNSALSRFNRLSSADSSVVVPGREPASTWAWRTHLRTVSAVPTRG